MTRRIRELQPDYYSDVYEFDKLAETEEKEFDLFADKLAKQLNNLYITNADDKGIKLFEREYSIIPNAEDNLEIRRRRIISRLLPPQPITLKFIDKLLATMNFNTNSEVDVVKGIYRTMIDANEFTDEQVDQLNGLLNTYVPVSLLKQIYKYDNYASELGSYIGVANTVTLYSYADYKGSEK